MLDPILSDRYARVLMYHSFLLPDVFFNVDPGDFRWQMEYVCRKKFQFVLLKDLATMCMRGETLKNCVTITFDDGHQDFLQVPYPVLSEKKIPATLFWSTAMKGDILVSPKGVSCPLLSMTEILSLAHDPLIEIGSHAETHRELSRLSDQEVRDEVVNSRKTLEALIQKSVYSFAYPRGKYNDQVVAAVRAAGYTCASTAYPPGIIAPQVDILRLPRIFIGQADTRLAFRAKLTTLYAWYTLLI